MERPIPRRVKEHIPEEQIIQDLKRYQGAALEVEGITDAAIIGREDIYVDPRVRRKCGIPICFGYGKSPYCPPHGVSSEETRKLVQCYRHAIFIKADVSPDIVAGEELAKAIVSGERDPEDKVIQTGRAYITIFKAVAKVESMAFYDGYYLATGFAAGSCKEVLCTKFPQCSVLEGNKCRRPYFARPSMEASAFDALRMAARIGWEVYPIGANCRPEDISHGTLMGLVLVT